MSFYDIDNIHAVRAGWKGLNALCEPGEDDLVWHVKLQENGALQSLWVSLL